jgi:neutral ceramidase
MFVGKLLYRAGKPPGAKILVQIRGVIRCGGFLQNQFVIIDQALLFPMMPPAHVQQDAVQPGVKRRFSAKLPPRLDRLDEGFLHHVLRVRLAAAEQIRRAQQTVAMRVDQLLDLKGIRAFRGGNARRLSHIYVICATAAQKVQLFAFNQLLDAWNFVATHRIMNLLNAGKSVWQVGVARRLINPPPGVELAGLGYYLNRTWQRIRDDLTATALVIGDQQEKSVALVALDLMYNDAAFTTRIRQLIAAWTDIQPGAICVNCSHSHNAPTAGFIRGSGEQNEAYLTFVANEAATAVVEAWRARQPARLFVGHGELSGMTFNRTREHGPTDTRLSVLRADTMTGRPLAVAVNFHSHCIAHMEVDLFAVSRDWPGEVVDRIEAALPGTTALYLQGTCGDVNFRREFNGTERRFEPAEALTKVTLGALEKARAIEKPGLDCITRKVELPTRRWDRDEVMRDREEGLHRIKTRDTTDWLDGMARTYVNQPERLPLRYGGSVEKAVQAIARFGVEWTTDILPVLDTKPETLDAEIQAIRIGDVYLAANPSELFTTLGLDLRCRWPNQDLFVLGYSNGSIGYLPDAYEIQRRGYAAMQSPKFTGQFPFTPNSGPKLVNETLAVLEDLHKANAFM